MTQTMTKPPRQDRVSVGLKLPEDDWEMFRQLAEANSRSLTAELILALRRHMAAHNLDVASLPPPARCAGRPRGGSR